MQSDDTFLVNPLNEKFINGEQPYPSGISAPVSWKAWLAISPFIIVGLALLINIPRSMSKWRGLYVEGQPVTATVQYDLPGQQIRLQWLVDDTPYERTFRLAGIRYTQILNDGTADLIYDPNNPNRVRFADSNDMPPPRSATYIAICFNAFFGLIIAFVFWVARSQQKLRTGKVIDGTATNFIGRVGAQTGYYIDFDYHFTSPQSNEVIHDQHSVYRSSSDDASAPDGDRTINIWYVDDQTHKPI